MLNPKTTKCVILDDKNTLSYGDLPLEEVGVDQVLVKVHSAAINPSDVMFTQGLYGTQKTKPCVPGLEGSGTVVSGGSSDKSKALIGKNVCFFASGENTKGSWGEYTVLSNDSVYPLP